MCGEPCRIRTCDPLIKSQIKIILNQFLNQIYAVAKCVFTTILLRICCTQKIERFGLSITAWLLFVSAAYPAGRDLDVHWSEPVCPCKLREAFSIGAVGLVQPCR